MLTYDDIEYIDKDENVMQTRASVEREEDRSRERKLKVGNKKTDKFFGESLSDHLSDEPIEAEVEEKKSSKDETDRSSTSDKKLFFLLNMLEQEHMEEEKYKGKVPVEEPLFIAKKKEIKKHICDDEDHLHEHLHKHEKEDHVVAPPKPDRDFSKYQASDNVAPAEELAKEIEGKNAAEAEEDKEMQAKIEAVQAKVEESLMKSRVKKSVSREDLPAPPEAPRRKTEVSSVPGTPTTPTIRIETIEFVTSSETSTASDDRNDEILDEKKATKAAKRPPALNLAMATKEAEEIETKPVSSTPILGHDIAHHMMQKTYGFQGFSPEDSEHYHEDGSDGPKSKLVNRKSSTTRKFSTESIPSSICSESELLRPGASTPRKKISFCDDPLKVIEETLKPRDGTSSPLSPPKSPTGRTRDYEKMLESPSMDDIIDEIYSKNSIIMQEFQTYLEKSIESKPVINVDQEKEFLREKGITDNEFSRAPQQVKNLAELEEDDNQSFSDSFESTDTEQETITEMKTLPKYNPNRRRESIEDVDGWFNNHLDLEQKESEICGSMETPPIPGYDTKTIFPFGRSITERRDSLSTDFLSDTAHAPVKRSVILVRDSESSGDDDQKEFAKFRKDKSPDHSTLLKYFDKDTKEN